MAGPAAGPRPPRDDTIDALQAASNYQDGITEQLHTAEQAIADAKLQLARYRAALDAGADPTEVTAWINQAIAAKATAETQTARLRATTPALLGPDELRRILAETGSLARTLHHADRELRAQLYARFGIEGLYQPAERIVTVTADLVCARLVSEGDSDLTYTGVLRGKLRLGT
jgi:site-specific DNA recombinase